LDKGLVNQAFQAISSYLPAITLYKGVAESLIDKPSNGTAPIDISRGAIDLRPFFVNRTAE